VVRVASPDGLTYTALLEETAERSACERAFDGFVAPVKEHCKECNVVFARCERERGAMDLALERDGARQHWVMSQGLRISVTGPEDSAKATCDFIAADLIKRGAASSSCVHPAAAARL
jgi:hypothetical protein